ncbi:MAG: ATP-binding cassette domain-containing protein [Mycoplasmataceae bacterium]|nr:ATP-binding cassette domain-containing protein [Mycoplasmataceae bacterium]
MGNNFIEIKDINKTYNDGFTAVLNFNLSIKKGEFITLLGPSGCGKTTMLKMLAGFEKPSYGRIIIDNIDVKNIAINKRCTATVFQDYALFPNMTIFQNISYGLKILKINDKNKYIGEDSDPKWVNKYNLKKANIDNTFIKDQKFSEKKINELEKNRKILEVKIAKVKQKFNVNSLLKQIGNLTKNQVINEINILYDEYEQNIVRKGFFHKVEQSSETKTIKTKIDALRKALKQKLPIDKELQKLYDQLDDLDYKITYWQNYAQDRKEQAEKRFTSRKLTKNEIYERAMNAIKLVGLVGNEKKYPDDLSGGMKQRVALARAIVVEPDVLLLDEPLSALDAKIRKQMQLELKRIHKQLGITFILVTHDQEEALTLSDRIVVMNFGKIMQIGKSNEIYDSPNSAWVANFIGVANVFNGVIKQNTTVECLSIITPYREEDKNIAEVDEQVDVLIRPEDFDVVNENEGFINATVKSILYKGLMWQVVCETSNKQNLTVESIHQIEVNKVIGLKWDSCDLHIMKKGEVNNV